MKISEVAEQIGVTTVTLRYYERVGLVPPIERKNNVRVYKQADLNWIEFIKCMRDAGLSVDSLIKYTSLYQLGNETIEERKRYFGCRTGKFRKEVFGNGKYFATFKSKN